MLIFNPLGEEQHGFTPDRSVETHLSELIMLPTILMLKLKLTLFILTLKKRLTLLTTYYYFINSNYLVFRVICYTSFNFTLLDACKGL